MSDLAAYLRNSFEQERADLAREIHDELGGLLVSTKLELSLLERELGPNAAPVRARINQIRQSLDSAVALKRRVVERLYPSLLGHVGLFATLSWYVEELAARTGSAFSARVPEKELRFRPPVAIALFRIVQESMGEATNGGGNTKIEVTAGVHEETLELTVRSTRNADSPVTASAEDYSLQSMQSRVAHIGGRLTRESPSPGCTVTRVRLDLPGQLRT